MHHNLAKNAKRVDRPVKFIQQLKENFKAELREGKSLVENKNESRRFKTVPTE